jgi:hypothetical protein
MRGLVFGAALTVLAMAAAVEAQTPAAPAAPATRSDPAGAGSCHPATSAEALP